MALVAPIRIRVQTKPKVRIRTVPRLIPLNATVEVGTVTTGAPGDPVTVVNVGTPSAVVLDFSIPQGEEGDRGDPGIMQSVAAGANVSVDSTDPANPVVSATGDITAAEVAAGYQPLDAILTATTASFTTALETKLNGIEALADVTDSGNVNPLIAAQVGVTVQAHGANLDTLSGIVPGAAGQAILADATGGDVRDYLDVPPYVADRTALAALDATKDTVAFVLDSSNVRDQRVFIWDGSDLAADVTAYGASGIFVPPTGGDGSTGAWVMAGARPTGGFAENQAAYPPRVHRFADRVYIGDGVTMKGNWPTPLGLDAVTNTLHAWGPREATLYVDAPNGGMAIVGYAQRSKKTKAGIVDYTAAGGAGIGISGFGVNDGLGAQLGPAWGGYFDCVRFPGAGFSVGIEVEIANLGAWLSMNPFNAKGSGVAQAGVGVWIGSGAGLDANGYDNSLGTTEDAAAGIVLLSSYADNSIGFGKGIIIANGALRDLGGGVFSAMEVPSASQFSWYRDNGAGAGQQAAYIWESGTVAGSAILGMRFGSDGISWRSGSTAILRGASVASAVNNLVVSPSATGGNTSVLAEGTDTNVGIVVRPKGSGSLLLQGGSAATKIGVNTTGLGFFGTTPIAKPTGVAVDAAGIHAALVSLGLIAA